MKSIIRTTKNKTPVPPSIEALNRKTLPSLGIKAVDVCQIDEKKIEARKDLEEKAIGSRSNETQAATTANIDSSGMPHVPDLVAGLSTDVLCDCIEDCEKTDKLVWCQGQIIDASAGKNLPNDDTGKHCAKGRAALIE